MKRFILSVLTVLALGGMLASCGSTLKLKGEEPVMNTGVPEIIDYQGLALGSQIPDWVIARGCVGAFQSADWALVKWLTGTDEVVDQALNDQQSRK